MSWLDGFTRNWADLREDADDPGLRAVIFPLPPAEAVARAVSVVEAMPRWVVVSADPTAGLLHATHRTLVWRFVDDVHLEFRPHSSGGTIITGRSKSRIGKGDLGQNARNLRELTASLRSADSSGSPARKEIT